MPDSNTTKNYKLISILIVLCVVGSYLGTLYIVETFTGSSSLANLLNSKHIMNKHQEELMKKILRDPHFNNVKIDEYISEVEKIITMEKKRGLGEWVSFKSFTPNVSGKYITTNDYGMRSKWNLKEMVQRVNTELSPRTARLRATMIAMSIEGLILMIGSNRPNHADHEGLVDEVKMRILDIVLAPST